MKKSTLILNVIYGLAILTLFILFFVSKSWKTGSSSGATNPGNDASDTSGTRSIRIAYVNTDTILANYEYYKEQTSSFEKDQKAAEKRYTDKLKKLEDDYKNYMYKINLGLITQAEAEKEFQKKQDELEAYRTQVTNTLLDKQQEVASQLYDSIISSVNRYNLQANYTYIIAHSKGSNILHADTSLDLTQVILTELNKSYAEWSDKGSTKKKK